MNKNIAFNEDIIDRIIEAGVFHVVLTGGEPMAKFPMLEHGFAKLKEANISFSCNSNLMLCTDERAKKLAKHGEFKKEEDGTIPIDQVITLDHLTNPDKK